MDHCDSQYLEGPSHSKTTIKKEMEESTCSDTYVTIEIDMKCTVQGSEKIQDVKSEPELPVTDSVADGSKTCPIVDGLNQAEENVGRDVPLRIKEEREDMDLDIGPTVLQPMDLCYTTNEVDLKAIKQKNILSRELERDKTVENSSKEPPSCLYLCNHCDQKFHCKSKLATHIQNMHRSKSYKCSICDENFGCEISLSTHTKEVHRDEDDKYHKCNKCLKVYKSKNCLWHHYRNIHTTELRKCVKCDKEFKCKAYLINHIRRMHREEQYECNICKKLFKSKITLSDHTLRFHRFRSSDPEDGSYHCDKCTKTFQSKIVLMTHRRQVHATERYKCEKCDSEFKCMPYLQRHIRHSHRDQQYECDVCNKVFKSKRNISIHFQIFHCDKFPDFKCNDCLKTFQSKQALNRHCRQLHSTDARKCIVCDKEFKCKAYLDSHFRQMHNECAVCKELYKSGQSLSDHVLKHHRHKKAVQSTNLHRHSHFYTCDHCQKTFWERRGLQKHIQCVHGLLVYPCVKCNRNFKCRKYLQKHKRKNHIEARHKCEECKIFFRTNCKLMNHRKRVHSLKDNDGLLKSNLHEYNRQGSHSTIGEKNVVSVTSTQKYDAVIVKQESFEVELEPIPDVFPPIVKEELT